jgi:hypothetical protein
MYNNTFFEYYRNAIKAKYEREKNEDRTIEVNAITTAKLRDLCVKRFKENNDKDDLNAFSSFFEFEFDPAKKNLITGKTIDKLKSIRRFFLGVTEDPTEDTIEFAAILLDFHPRPFYKFSKVMEGKSEDEITEELAKKYDYVDSGSNKNEDGNDPVPETAQGNPVTENPTNQILSTDNFTVRKTFFEKLKTNKLSIIAIICLLLIACYFLFFNKGCMQWSDNHYEVVDCKEGIEGNPNEIIIYDSNLLDFKKIQVCDTTTWSANGKAIIWYAKTDNEVSFFTTCGNGRDPESGSTIRPVTKHIFNKYKKPCKTK